MECTGWSFTNRCQYSPARSNPTGARGFIATFFRFAELYCTSFVIAMAFQGEKDGGNPVARLVQQFAADRSNWQARASINYFLEHCRPGRSNGATRKLRKHNIPPAPRPAPAWLAHTGDSWHFHISILLILYLGAVPSAGGARVQCAAACLRRTARTLPFNFLASHPPKFITCL